jgi:hypothetical protein
MSTIKALSILLLFLALFVMKGHAATVIAAGTKTVGACRFAAEPTAEIVSELHYPADWKVVVVCNENVWDTLMRQDRVNFISDYAFTYRPNRVTFIRAKVFLAPMKYSPEQVLKHELGHMLCRCAEEEIAAKWANKYK